jgi:DNA-binding GntR family transcriptional regulator
MVRRVGQTPRPSLSRMVYDHLVDQIIRGRVRYGDTLNIKAIARDFGVSPMPIRDAIKRLEAENIVAVRPRSNCYVRRPTEQTMLQAVESREMLEMFAVEKAWRAVTAEELAPLARIVEEMAALAARRRQGVAVDRQYIELDHQFHTEICRLAGNEYLQRFYRETSLHLSMSYRYGLSMCHGMRATLEEHKAIFEKLRANSPLAVSLLRAHLEQSRQNIMREYRLETGAPEAGSAGRGLPDPPRAAVRAASARRGAAGRARSD